MRIFIKKTVFFLLLFPIILIGYHIILDTFYNGLKTNDAIYIWGDSQAYQGLNIPKFKEAINQEIYTSAKHGAGVYDFLIFTKKVPKNSKVLITISNLVLVRRKENDYNRTGLSLAAFHTLYKNNYSSLDILRIILKNKKPSSIFQESTKLYANTDSMVIKLPISHFEKYYKNIPTFMESKQNIMLEGIKTLRSKGCKIMFIAFPNHPILDEIENNSPIKPIIKNFKYEVLDIFEKSVFDTINITTSKNIMYDLSHLNKLGASIVSEKLGSKINFNNPTTIYIVNNKRKYQ